VGLAIIFLASIALGLLVINQLRGSSPSPSPTSGGRSYNWVGYTVSSDLRTPQPNVWTVSATWVVPTIKATGLDSYSAAWIRVGGTFDGSLIQAGTEADSVFGSPIYSTWYEILPYDSLPVSSMTISPVDLVTVSISLTNATSGTWSIKISDATSGQSFNKTMTYSSSRLSAEWIVERPLVNGAMPPLASFTTTTFTSCSATIGATTGGISAFPYTIYNLYWRTNTELASCSPLGAAGSSFTVTFLSAE